MTEVFVDNKYQGGFVGDLETLTNHFQGGDSTNPLDEYDIEALISSQDNIDLIVQNKLPLTEEAKFALNKILKYHDKDYIDNFRSTYFTKQEVDTLSTPVVGEIVPEVVEEVDVEPKKASANEQLFNGLVKDGLYNKSYEEFQDQFSTESAQQNLYKAMKNDELYNKSAGDFMNTFFPITEELETEVVEDVETVEEVIEEKTTEEVETEVEKDESTTLEASYMQKGESKEDFYKRTAPTTREISGIVAGSYRDPGPRTVISGITKLEKFGMGDKYINQNNELATEEEIIQYNELEQLHNIRNEALAITSRSAGDYSDLSASEIIKKGKEKKKEDVDITEVGDIDETLDYEFEDYLEYNQEELINNWGAFVIKTNAPLIADQEKVQTELLNTKWEEFQKRNEADINADVKRIEQEIRSFYNPKLAKVTTQAELDLINKEMRAEFQTSVNLQVNKYYNDVFNAEMLEDEDLNAMGARHQEKWKKTTEKQWDQYVKNFKPKYDTFTPEILDKIGEDLDQNYNFQYKNGPEKKMLLQRALDGYIREMGLPEGQTLEDAKNEYWSYFYKKLAFDPSSTNEDGTPTYSQWAYKDIAIGALEKSNKELTEETKKYKPKKELLYVNKAGVAKYRTVSVEEQALNARPELKRIIDFSQRVLDNPEEMSKNGFVNFWKGLTSLQGHEYIPIIGGVVELNNSAHFYKLAKKENRTEMEDLALSMYAIKNASDKKVSELGSTAYNGGKIGGGSVSFMGEVMLTSGLYTSVRKGIQKTIKESLDKKVNKLVASKIDDLMAKAVTTGRGKSLV